MRYLLFDKSAFQALSDGVHALVRERYSTITTSTLLHEIAGNLASDRTFRNRTREEQAALLARKFGNQVETHRDWQDLCLDALLGKDVLANGPILNNGVDGYTPQGTAVTLHVVRNDGSIVSPQRNWVDLVASRSWGVTYEPDRRVLLQEVQKLWGKLADRAHPLKRSSTQEASELTVVAEVDRLLEEPSLQEPLIEWLARHPRGMSEHHLWRQFHGYWKSRMRWEYEGRPTLRHFAPYAYHCARVQLLYLVGFAIWPKRRELNDLADIEYLHLLPFTHVFASNDKFVRAMTRHLLRADQVLTCSCKLEQELTRSRKAETVCQH